MNYILAVIIIECIIIGFSIGINLRKYHVNTSDIIPKKRKTFQGLLANTTPHTFREIRYAIPEEGELC